MLKTRTWTELLSVNFHSVTDSKKKSTCGQRTHQLVINSYFIFIVFISVLDFFFITMFKMIITLSSFNMSLAGLAAKKTEMCFRRWWRPNTELKELSLLDSLIRWHKYNPKKMNIHLNPRTKNKTKKWFVDRKLINHFY